MLGDAPDKDTRMWAMLCHLSGLALFTSIPFANLIAPLIVWLVKRESSSYIDEHGKEALNFQITVSIGLVITGVLSMLLIGIPFLFALIIYDVVLIVIAAVRANDGRPHRYPLTIRFVR